jgi:hypothetical protein
MEPEQVNFAGSAGGEPSSSSQAASRKTQRIPFGRGSSQQGSSAGRSGSANNSKLQVEHNNIRTGT